MSIERPPTMALTALHCGRSRIKWGKIIDDLSLRFQRPTNGLVNLVDVCNPATRVAEIFSAYPNFLLAGKQALDTFVKTLPRGFRMKHLDYGVPAPLLYVIDSVTGFNQFLCALYYPEPTCTRGKDIFNGCVFLLENEWTIKDRLYLHQVRRHFAPHEASIFGIEPLSLPPPPDRRSR